MLGVSYVPFLLLMPLLVRFVFHALLSIFAQPAQNPTVSGLLCYVQYRCRDSERKKKRRNEIASAVSIHKEDTPQRRLKDCSGGENHFMTKRIASTDAAAYIYIIRKYPRRPFSVPRITFQRAKNEILHREGRGARVRVLCVWFYVLSVACTR